MKRSIVAFVAAVAWASAAWAQPVNTLTTLRAIHALSNADAARALPVEFEATVTYVRAYEKLLFVQDEDAAIFVSSAPDEGLAPGDRILIRGTTQQSFRPVVLGTAIALLRHGSLPAPIPTDFDELIRAQRDCQFVRARGWVRAADLVVSHSAPARNARIQLVTDEGRIELNVDSDDSEALNRLLDTEVEVMGVAGGWFDGKMQQLGVELHVASLADIRVVHSASADPWSVPFTPFGEILTRYHVRDLTQRVRIRGAITYYQPGFAIVLQNGPQSLWIATHTLDPVQIGDLAEVIGLPDMHDRALTLADGEVHDLGIHAPITPRPSTWSQLAFWSSNSPEGHQFDLVSVEGQVVAEVREAARDEYVLVADGRLFTATFRHSLVTGELPRMVQLPLGSKVRFTGICMLEDLNRFRSGENVPFDILLRSYDDIAVVAGPSLLSIRNLVIAVGLLLALVVAIGARGWTIERKARRQTAASVAMECRRSRILEDINGSRPLTEIIEQILEWVSSRLGGAPCWCQIADGAHLGGRLVDMDSLRIIRSEMRARSGASLGVLLAGVAPAPVPSINEAEALSAGAALATLAIESHRLHSDLLRRSEFDLLTDIHNRFSLDKRLDTEIDAARRNASVFGLIYIDLNLFKQINDRYGHHVGDVYLQQVAKRMKSQLRPADTLARLGGDEFAALVSVVRSRADVEEIALRMERCFDEAFLIDGLVLTGSASIGIALYPENAATKDELFNAADATMYAAKRASHQAA